MSHLERQLLAWCTARLDLNLPHWFSHDFLLIAQPVGRGLQGFRRGHSGLVALKAVNTALIMLYAQSTCTHTLTEAREYLLHTSNSVEHQTMPDQGCVWALPACVCGMHASCCHKQTFLTSCCRLEQQPSQPSVCSLWRACRAYNICWLCPACNCQCNHDSGSGHRAAKPC